MAQSVERWSHNPKVVSSILTPGKYFARMNSEGSGLGFQIRGGLTSQWFKSTFCAFFFASNTYLPTRVAKRCSMRGSNPRPLAHKTNTLPTELMEPTSGKNLGHRDLTAHEITSSVRGLVVMIVACQVMDPGSIPGERSSFLFFSHSRQKESDHNNLWKEWVL